MCNRTLLRTVAPALLVAVAVASTPAQTLRLAFDGQDPSGQAGYISALGDLDGDGADDLVIGAPGALNANGDAGVVTVRSGATGAVLMEVLGGASAIGFGRALGAAGDFDGDGVEDLLVGDPFDDHGNALTFVGHVAVFSGSNGSELFSAYGIAQFDKLGSKCTGVGDLDGDGTDEIAYSILGQDAVIVVRSLAGGGSATLWSWTGQAGNHFGAGLASAGDVDADGTPDVIVGEPHFDTTGRVPNENGRAVVYSGKTGLPIWDLRGGAPFNHFGNAVDGVGDVDGDGHADVIVGCAEDDTTGTDAGKATLFSGRTGLALYTLYGTAAGDRFGVWLAGAGDLDGDGVGDLAIDANGSNSSIGRVTTFSGKDGTKFHDYDHATDQAWGFVDGGDFDGDGDADLLLGNPIAGTNIVGRVEIYETCVATWSNYGAGWPGTLGIPALTALNDPVIGGAIDVFIGNSLGVATTCQLLLGNDDASIPTKKGGTLLVIPVESIVFTLDASGNTLTDTVPDDPAVCDVEVFVQVLEVDPGASKKLSFSAGLKLHLGYAYP